MLGLVLSLIYAGWKYLTGTDVYAVYQAATGFLYQWYIWTTVLYAVFYIGVALLVWLGVTAWGTEGGPLGAILGFLGGGALSCLVLILAAISRVCLILGSLFLTQALVVISGVPTWDTVKLIFGGLLVLVGIIMGRGSSSSSSKKD